MRGVGEKDVRRGVYGALEERLTAKALRRMQYRPNIQVGLEGGRYFRSLLDGDLRSMRRDIDPVAGSNLYGFALRSQHRLAAGDVPSAALFDDIRAR